MLCLYIPVPVAVGTLAPALYAASYVKEAKSLSPDYEA